MSEFSRIDVLRSTKLLDSPPEVAFDRLTRLAAGLVGAPVALVSLVDEHRQFFKSAFGLAEPWAARRETPITHSFCKLAVTNRSLLIVDDAREHPILRTNLAIRDLNVLAYAGIPMMVNDEAIGAFCVVDDKPRHWTDSEIQLLQDLADSVVAEIELRMALRAESEQRALVHMLIEGLGDAVLAVDTQRRFLVANRTARLLFDGPVVGKTLSDTWSSRQKSLKPDGQALAPGEGALVRALEGLETDHLTFTVNPPLGDNARWVEATGRPVRNAEGELISAVAVYRDVTERMYQTEVHATVIRNLPNASVAIFNRDLRCLAIDGEVIRSGRGVAEQMIGKTMAELSGRDANNAGYAAVDAMYRGVFDGHTGHADYQMGQRVLELSAAPVRDPLGRIDAGVVLVLDRTAERAAMQAIARSEQVHRAIVEYLPNGGVFLVDHDLRYVAAEGKMAADIERRGIPAMVGKLVTEVVSQQNRDVVLEVFRAALSGENRRLEVGFADRFFELNTGPIFDEQKRVTHAVAFLYDITERKLLAERELTIDTLTGIANRRGAESALAIEDARRKRAGSKLSVAIFDVDHFKQVNDVHGHSAGDAVLRLVASTLHRQGRATDVIARWGGEEFLAVLPGPIEGGLIFCERARRAISQLEVPKAQRITISVGVAELGADESPLEAVSRADERLYAAKRAGRNRVVG